jgi:parvulin-like peptidyl-prolyl isomerase
MKLKTLLTLLFILSLFVNNYAQSLKKKVSHVKAEFKNTTKHIFLKEKYSNEDYTPYIKVYKDLKNKKQKLYVESISKIKSIKKGDVIVCGKIKKEQKVELLKVIEIDSSTRTKSRHILIRDETDENINMVFKKLKSGEKFEELALKYGQDGTRTNGGDLGYFYSGQMPEEFEKAILSHSVGEAFIIKTNFGFHIVESLENPKRIISFKIFKLIFDPEFKPMNGKGEKS